MATKKQLEAAAECLDTAMYHTGKEGFLPAAVAAPIKKLQAVLEARQLSQEALGFLKTHQFSKSEFDGATWIYKDKVEQREARVAKQRKKEAPAFEALQHLLAVSFENGGLAQTMETMRDVVRHAEDDLWKLTRDGQGDWCRSYPSPDALKNQVAHVQKYARRGPVHPEFLSAVAELTDIMNGPKAAKPVAKKAPAKKAAKTTKAK